MKRFSNPRKISLLFYATGIIFLGLTVSRVADLVLAGSRSARRSPLLSPIRRSGASGDGTVTLEEYATIRAERFCIPVPPSPEPAPRSYTPSPSGENPRPPIVLRGTLVHSNPALSRAFIEIPGLHPQRACQLGETVDGAELVSIEYDMVRLVRGDEEIIATVSFGEGGRGTPQRPSDPRQDSTSTRQAPGAGSQQATREDVLGRLPPPYRTLFESLPGGEQQKIVEMPVRERFAYLREKYRETRGEEPPGRRGERQLRRGEGTPQSREEALRRYRERG